MLRSRVRVPPLLLRPSRVPEGRSSFRRPGPARRARRKARSDPRSDPRSVSRSDSLSAPPHFAATLAASWAAAIRSHSVISCSLGLNLP
jgi:hypothetical protein